ncbi:MAG: hypothetical protein ACHQ4J_12195, partial [Candidatus Binatia bacterium]
PTPTNTPTNTPTPTTTPTPTNTPTPTVTSTPTITPTVTATNTSSPGPVIVNGTNPGSTDVTGTSGTGCPESVGACTVGGGSCGCDADCPSGTCSALPLINIFDCDTNDPGPPVCHDGNDPVIGKCQKCQNASFNCPLFNSIPLQPGQIIYATDGCFDPIRVGPDVVIGRHPAVPLLSPVMIVVMAFTLCLVGLLGLARVRWSK